MNDFSLKNIFQKNRSHFLSSRLFSTEMKIHINNNCMKINFKLRQYIKITYDSSNFLFAKCTRNWSNYQLCTFFLLNRPKM
jgi:hypothetical protein